MGGRQTVRKALARTLTPNLTARDATATHQALLTLGRSSRDDRTRLVTTNFDRLFEEVTSTMQLSVESFRGTKGSRSQGVHGMRDLFRVDRYAASSSRMQSKCA